MALLVMGKFVRVIIRCIVGIDPIMEEGFLLSLRKAGDLNSFCDELLFLEISTTCGFGVFYRLPSQGANELIALSNCLLSVSTLPIVLCGDFNLPFSNNLFSCC